jgi:hypothetical protein
MVISGNDDSHQGNEGCHRLAFAKVTSVSVNGCCWRKVVTLEVRVPTKRLRTGNYFSYLGSISVTIA